MFRGEFKSLLDFLLKISQFPIKARINRPRAQQKTEKKNADAIEISFNLSLLT